MTYKYFEWEDRLYRAPPRDLAKMEIRWSDGSWQPYQGDVARVLSEALHLHKPPKGVK